MLHFDIRQVSVLFSTTMNPVKISYAHYKLMRMCQLQNSWLSALPYIVMWVLSIVITQIADLLIAKGKARTVVVRKACQSIGKVNKA